MVYSGQKRIISILFQFQKLEKISNLVMEIYIKTRRTNSNIKCINYLFHRNKCPWKFFICKGKLWLKCKPLQQWFAGGPNLDFQVTTKKNPTQAVKIVMMRHQKSKWCNNWLSKLGIFSWIFKIFFQYNAGFQILKIVLW